MTRERYKNDPPKINLEGDHAKKMIQAGHKPGDHVDMTVRAKVSRAESYSAPREYGPQHSMGMEIVSMKPAKPPKAPVPAKPAAPAKAKAAAKPVTAPPKTKAKLSPPVAAKPKQVKGSAPPALSKFAFKPKTK